MPKAKIVTYTKGDAYIYLKTLLEKSKEFKKDVEELRKSYKIDLSKIEGDIDDDKIALKHVKRLEIGLNPPDLSNKTKFKQLCKKYFIPNQFQKGLNHFVYTNNTTKLLSDSVKLIYSSDNKPKELKDELLIPHALLYIPLNISQQKYSQNWKEVKVMLQEAQKHFNSFFTGVHKWKNGVMFDRALEAYRLHKEGKKRKEIFEELVKKKFFLNNKQFDDQGEPYGWISNIEKQIVSLQNWK